MDVSRIRVGGAMTSLSAAGGLHQFPLPAGVVSAHVRHGDKGSETNLVPFSEYLAAAERLVRNGPFALRRALFVSSEDADVFAEANSSEAVLNSSWATRWYDFPTANIGGLEQMGALASVMPAGRLIRFHLLQLLMHLECDAWVGTRASNWNRLIDELRSVWVDKRGHAFTEVGSTRLDFDTYNW
jgi:hypothetical protein